MAGRGTGQRRVQITVDKGGYVLDSQLVCCDQMQGQAGVDERKMGTAQDKKRKTNPSQGGKMHLQEKKKSEKTAMHPSHKTEAFLCPSIESECKGEEEILCGEESQKKNRAKKPFLRNTGGDFRLEKQEVVVRGLGHASDLATKAAPRKTRAQPRITRVAGGSKKKKGGSAMWFKGTPRSFLKKREKWDCRRGSQGLPRTSGAHASREGPASLTRWQQGGVLRTEPGEESKRMIGRMVNKGRPDEPAEQ